MDSKIERCIQSGMIPWFTSLKLVLKLPDSRQKPHYQHNGNDKRNDFKPFVRFVLKFAKDVFHEKCFNLTKIENKQEENTRWQNLGRFSYFCLKFMTHMTYIYSLLSQIPIRKAPDERPK